MERNTASQLARPAWPGLLGLVIICLFASPLQARDVAAKVQFAVGEVSATSADGKTRPLKKGDRIYTGDTVKTGERGSAQLIYRDRSRMAVRVNTEFKIREYRYDENNKKGAISVFSLLGGALRAVSGLIGSINPQRVTVETPIATIGIRGTDHEIVVVTKQMKQLSKLADVGTYNKVYAGATVIKTPRGNMNLDLNQTGFVGGSSRADVVKPVKLKDLPRAIKSQLINKIPVQAKTLPKNNKVPASGGDRKNKISDVGSPDVGKTPTPGGQAPVPYPGRATVGDKVAPTTILPTKSLQNATGVTAPLKESITNLPATTLNPSISRPKTAIEPKVSIPTTKVAPKVSIPTTSVPKVSVPTSKVTPKVNVPKATAPVVPKVTVPKKTAPVVPKVSIPTTTKAVPKVSAPKATKALPSTTLPTKTLPKTLKKP